ncbi:MAG TPA: glycoside hydrolase family 5 protein, partial [Polyangiaceae bacterium]|nr:glycoside hydrolase family 5 protein [Polyangiaceae bacterium]
CGSCADDLLCTPTGRCWDNSVTPVARHGQLAIDGTKIVDSHGDVTQLKGVSTQWLNWEQAYSTSREAMRWLRDNWGLSVFRIANGIEGQNGYLTEPADRLEMVRDIIDNAIANEVYVLVDWHTHEPEHLDEAKAFFAAIAEEYGDEPNVIYELFNEPLALDWSTELKPYHEELLAVIRAHDPDNLVVVGTPRWDQRPDLAVADPIADANVAYTLHFYACSHQAAIRANGSAALAGGLPLFVTEWGATHADGGTAANPGVCETPARDWHAWLEENDVSWAAWKLDDGDDSSSMLATGASVNGGWDEDDLHGHAYLVREFMLDER